MGLIKAFKHKRQETEGQLVLDADEQNPCFSSQRAESSYKDATIFQADILGFKQL